MKKLYIVVMAFGWLMNGVYAMMDPELNRAVTERNVERVIAILNRDTSFDTRYRGGLRPIHKAVLKGLCGAVQLILDNNSSDIESVTNMGLTPLHVASAKGAFSIVGLLLEKGAAVNAQTNAGETPLHIAAKAGRYGVLELLLREQKIDIHARDACGMTPLHCAAQGGRLWAVSYLLQSRADPMLEDNDGRSALALVNGEEHPEIISRLNEEIKKKQKRLERERASQERRRGTKRKRNNGPTE